MSGAKRVERLIEDQASPLGVERSVVAGVGGGLGYGLLRDRLRLGMTGSGSIGSAATGSTTGAGSITGSGVGCGGDRLRLGLGHNRLRFGQNRLRFGQQPAPVDGSSSTGSASARRGRNSQPQKPRRGAFAAGLRAGSSSGSGSSGSPARRDWCPAMC